MFTNEIGTLNNLILSEMGYGVLYLCVLYTLEYVKSLKSNYEVKLNAFTRFRSAYS